VSIGYPSPDVDPTAAHKLYLWIRNDGDLYRQMHEPIMKNLDRKRAKGIFDMNKARKAFVYLADEGAQRYHKEFGSDTFSGQPWHRMFNPATRRAAAEALLQNYMERLSERDRYPSRTPTRPRMSRL